MREVKAQQRAEAERRKAEQQARRDREKRVEALEMKILHLEGRQKDLATELEKPESYASGGAAMQLNRDLLAVTSEIERLTAEWDALAAKPL